MDLSIKIAESNETYSKWRLACVLVKGGSVLSVGQSKLRCNPAHCDFDMPGIRERVSVHAEEAAIKACGNPRGAVLYVARVGRNGLPASSKPCLRCQSKILDAGVKRCYYLDENGVIKVWPPDKGN